MQIRETPGVYHERIDAGAHGISALRTDIAAFVGIAAKGPLDTPVPVESWRQFQAYFGDFIGGGYLAYAVRAFFENGGSRCWVVRIASEVAADAHTPLMSVAHGAPPRQIPVWRVAAFSFGVWGNDLEITVKETHRSQTVADASTGRPEYSIVAGVAGFARASHVRLRQGLKPPVYKVVSDVDAGEKRLFWIHPRAEARLPYDSALSGFDPNQSILIESVEYTLLVRELGRLVGVYEHISVVPEHERYGPRILPPVDDADAKRVPAGAPQPVVITELRDLSAPADLLAPIEIGSGAPIALQGGADGLAQLKVVDFIGEEFQPYDSDIVKARRNRGVRALEAISEVAIVAVPDIHIQPVAVPTKAPPPPCIPDPCLPAPDLPSRPRVRSAGDLPPIFSEQQIFQVQSAMVQHCEKRRDRIALLDPPYKAARDDRLGLGAARAWRSRFDSKYAAFYYPWLRVVDPLRSPAALTRDVPPSGHVAGQYAHTDVAVGVHKAPANSPLIWTEGVTVAVSDAAHGVLNPQGINVIRPLPGRGMRILGARTISSDPQWRFVNVRRLLMMIEKAIEGAVQWAVFEPNNDVTRAKLRLALTSFLLELWRKGALIGRAAEEAFFVKCDETTNPAAERAGGRLLAEIGVAPSYPFEFVILRVGRANNELEIAEAGERAGGGVF